MGTAFEARGETSIPDSMAEDLYIALQTRCSRPERLRIRMPSDRATAIDALVDMYRSATPTHEFFSEIISELRRGLDRDGCMLTEAWGGGIGGYLYWLVPVRAAAIESATGEFEVNIAEALGRATTLDERAASDYYWMYMATVDGPTGQPIARPAPAAPVYSVFEGDDPFAF
jgi:hypothetical protein